MKFKYTVAISEHLPFGDGKRFIEMHTGMVSAPDYVSAKEKAWKPIGERGEILQKELGIIVAYGHVQILVCRDETPVLSAEQIVALIHRHLEQAKTNEQRSIQIHKQTKGRGKALTRSAKDVCSGRTMALQVLLNEIELGTDTDLQNGASESHASEEEPR